MKTARQRVFHECGCRLCVGIPRQGKAADTGAGMAGKYDPGVFRGTVNLDTTNTKGRTVGMGIIADKIRDLEEREKKVLGMGGEKALAKRRE
ncbi:MAG: hypothetical protein V1793_11165, partial [Pseudomonadota bacterium]